jgi:hypothetical protein
MKLRQVLVLTNNFNAQDSLFSKNYVALGENACPTDFIV